MNNCVLEYATRLAPCFLSPDGETGRLKFGRLYDRSPAGLQSMFRQGPVALATRAGLGRHKALGGVRAVYP
jgi:hypothetical protein